GLIGQVREAVVVRSPDGLTPAEQLLRIGEEVSKLARDQQTRWRQLRDDLLLEGILLTEPDDLTRHERNLLDECLLGHIFPILTPLAVDPAHPFPFIPNLGFTIALDLTRIADGRSLNALIRVPNRVERFVRIPDFAETGAARFIALENLAVMFIGKLFPGY